MQILLQKSSRLNKANSLHAFRCGTVNPHAHVFCPASHSSEHCIYVHRITTNLPIKQTRFTAAYRQPIQFGFACNKLSHLPLVFHQSDSRHCFNKPGLV